MITIVDYRAGNLTSVQLAFEHLGERVEITDNAPAILAAERIVFPGVGAAASAMANLRQLDILDALKEAIAGGAPFLGICIGMQLLFDFSEEDGGTPCIGLLPGMVRRFRPSNPADKIPQMGWNAVRQARRHPLFAGIEDQSEFYFVHSYYPAPSDRQLVIGETEYADIVFASAAGRDNLVSVQFHPERSGRIGLRLLEAFCRWDGRC
ncbi:MAG TPA: imidazole glycerol phosphate synthase subunit HisH [Sedimentisphaerales bacterium]|nr:imidazole glycerol phosphate synthase subunit HisH [Sedimentisphaerales bacterium]